MRPTLIILSLAFWACEAPIPEPDAGADGGVEADVEVERFGFELRVEASCGFPWERGEPVAGAQVAVDDASGHAELVTDSEGVTAVSIDPGEPFTLTVACPLYRPVVTLYELTRDEVEAQVAARGAVIVQLCRQEAEVERRQVVLHSSGLPEGVKVFSGRYDQHIWLPWMPEIEPAFPQSSSLDGWLAADNNLDFQVELRPGNRWLTALLAEPSRAGPMTITGLSAVHLEDDDDTTFVTFSFDDRLEPVVLEGITLRWPVGSLLERRGPSIHPQLLAPYGPTAALDSPAWGGAVRRAETATSITVDVTHFPVEGVRFFWEIDVVADGLESTDVDQPRSRLYLSRPPEPGATFDVLDIPILEETEAQRTLRSSFAWTSVEGADRYRLDLVDATSIGWSGTYRARAEQLHAAILWSVISPSSTQVTLPELPSGYSADWWWLEEARPLIHAYRNLPVEDRDPTAGPYVDYEHSFSYGEMVSLER